MANLVKQPTARPTRKVTAGFSWGLATAALITVINKYFPDVGDLLQDPNVSALLTALVTSGAAYLTKERA